MFNSEELVHALETLRLLSGVYSPAMIANDSIPLDFEKIRNLVVELKPWLEQIVLAGQAI